MFRDCQARVMIREAKVAGQGESRVFKGGARHSTVAGDSGVVGRGDGSNKWNISGLLCKKQQFRQAEDRCARTDQDRTQAILSGNEEVSERTSQFDLGDCGVWDSTRRIRMYECLLDMIKDPRLAELTVEEAQGYVRQLREDGIRVGGFFPPDIKMAARSLKLTRRLFHVGESSLCDGQGLWLNKGVQIRKGQFVGLYVGWVYTPSMSESVWDPIYLDNTYSLGLQGIGDQAAAGEGLRINARDDRFGRQELVFTLGYANEWIWETEGQYRKSNSLRFGKDGMVFAQRAIQGTRARVEVTIGFGKEGIPFGGWFRYTIQLACRLCEVVKMVWLQTQRGLREETVKRITEFCLESRQRLDEITFLELPELRGSRSGVAILIAGVEFQEGNDDWGWLSYDEGISLQDNLRRFVLHPMVRARCTFRLADRPGKASTRGIGDVDFWDRLLVRERKLMVNMRTKDRPRTLDGCERVDGKWEWCVPVPLQQLVEERQDAETLGEEVGYEEGINVVIAMAESGLGQMDSSSGISRTSTGEDMDGREVGKGQCAIVQGGGGSCRRRVSMGREDELGRTAKERGSDDGADEERLGSTDRGLGISSVGWDSQVERVGVFRLSDGDEAIPAVDQLEASYKTWEAQADSAEVNAVTQGWVVGSRWIYDYEEIEICAVISPQEVEVVYRDQRREIISGPLCVPDEDDFVGWPRRAERQELQIPACDLGDKDSLLQLYNEDLDLMGFSGGVRELLEQTGMRLSVVGDRKIRLATWNASGLTKISKVRYLMALMTMANIDILCIQDTRLEPGQWTDEIEQELKKLLGPGGSVFIATVATRTLGSKGPNVGGQVILKSPRIRSSCSFQTDESMLGLICCLDIQLGSHDTRIVSVYVPPSIGEKIEGLYGGSPGGGLEPEVQDYEYRGALAVRTLQYIQQSDRWDGCISYILGYAQQKIDQQLKVPGSVVFCVGDFNASGDLVSKRSVNGSIAEWAEIIGMQHSMSARQMNCPLTFFRGSEGVSAIDHILYSGSPGVTPVDHCVLNDSVWLSLSNHCPLTVEFEMSGLSDAYISRRCRRRAQSRERLDICRFRESSEEGTRLRDVDDFRKYIDERLRPDTMVGSADDQLELVMKVSKAALRSVCRRRRKTDWWSPAMVALSANLVALHEMERYALGRGRPKWCSDVEWQVGVECIVSNWRRQVAKINVYRGEGTVLDLLRVSGTGPEGWEGVYVQPLEERIRLITQEIRRLRHLLRQQDRLEISQGRQEVAVRRLEARSRGTHLRELRDMMGGKTGFSMDYIVDSGLYVVDEQRVHDIVSAHFSQWFSRKERDWGFLAADSDYKRLWTDRDAFVLEHSQSNIPIRLLDVVWTAMRPRQSSPEMQKLFEQNLMEAPTLEEFERELAGTSRHSAGGPTGVTYNTIAGWPRWLLTKVHFLLVGFWNDKSIPRCWKWRWLVPIPKKRDNVTLDDLRPLMLTDVIRKVWVGVLVHKIQDHLDSNGLLSRAQHGTLAHRGTEGALIQFRNILEEARESCTDVFLSSWDVVKAFDRLQKQTQIMSWTRLGVPEEIAIYLVSMDDGGVTIVRSPFAEQVWEKEGVHGFASADPRKTAAFSPTAGTGQGNIDSPLVWSAFMDILLCALGTLEENQFYIRTNDSQGEGLSVVQDIAYVDDLVSLTSRVQGLQDKADIVCAFFLIFGMDSARIKFRTFQVEWGAEYTSLGLEGIPIPSKESQRKYILVYKEGWQARKVWLQTYKTSPPFKYLGVLFDMSNLDGASFDRSMSVARKGISMVCRSLGDFELKTEAILYCVYPKLVYSAKFASWPLRRYLEIDRLFSSAFRRVLGLRKGFPEELLYAPWGVRGIGLSRFSDEVQMAKLAILCRGSTSDAHTREATMGLMFRGFRQQNVKPLYTQAATLGAEYISSQPLFIKSLTEWLMEGEVALRKGGIDTVNTSNMSIREMCLAHDTPLTIKELAQLEAYGIASIGDIIMCKDYVELHQSRRGRSRTRAIEGLQRRGMEGMKVVAPIGSYDIVRYVNPGFLIQWEDGRLDSRQFGQINQDIAQMSAPPIGSTVHWVMLPSCLQFLYGKLPPRPPSLTSVILARDQCWCSEAGRFPMSQGWVWEILGFSEQMICVRLWRVDGGVMCRQLRVGSRVRLVSPSHGAASSVWVPRAEVLCGDGWQSGVMYRTILGPDLNNHGVFRETIAIFTQPAISFFKAEMEIGLLSTIHEYAGLIQDSDIYTDGSVFQEENPIINALIPSPSLHRALGQIPVVAGALVARQDSPAAHVSNVALRFEDGQMAGCCNSYDIEMVMLALACMVRDQLKDVISPTCSIWSDCKSAVHKASQVDVTRIRQVGHRQHGLLLRRMFHSRHEDSSLLKHVKGHPERRLEKGKGWQELTGSNAGIFLADKLANARMSEDERYLWENDGSILAPLVTSTVSELLRVFADIDLWSVVEKDGTPILDSPLARVQAARFRKYLAHRDRDKVDKVWTQYVTTAPATAFPEERLYHRRSKITKVVYNWYLRSEQLIKTSTAEKTQDDTESPEGLGNKVVENCQLCDQSFAGDTERHLYVQCSHREISCIREKAERDFNTLAAEAKGGVQQVLLKLQEFFLDAGSRHRVWKGMISIEQGKQLSEVLLRLPSVDKSGIEIFKAVKEGLRIGGAALLAIRKVAWQYGGPVLRAQHRRVVSHERVNGNRRADKSTSIVTTLGIMSPTAAVRWELERRKRKRDRTQAGKERAGHREDATRLRQGLRSSQKVSRKEPVRKVAIKGQHMGGSDSGGARLWDVH